MMAPAEAAALVTVIDPDQAVALRADRVRSAFKLTEREAEMSAALMAGHSVESAAAVLGIGLPTARTYMRNLYDKTDSNGQLALVRMLSRIF